MGHFGAIGVTVNAIKAANGLGSNIIFVGQVLLIPDGGGGRLATAASRLRRTLAAGSWAGRWPASAGPT